MILNEIRNFCESPFKKGDSKRPSQINDFLDKVQLPKLNITEISACLLKIGDQFLYSMWITKLSLTFLHQGSKRSFLI